MFTFQEMQDFAYWYHNWFTNRERPDVEEAFDVWFENYGSRQIEKSGFWKKKPKK